MSETIEAEVVQGNRAVAVRQAGAVGQALGVNEIIAQVRLIQEVMGKVMKNGEHYGTIPGCGDKKTLLQPGAQKLTMTFRLAPEYELQETDLERGHKEYRVICTLKSIQSGTFVGQGVGCCSTMESKYRWRGGARKCPECGKEAIIKGKADFGGGWLCWQKKGGCGHKWPDGAAEIEAQSIEKVENDNPADCFNTVLKMAKKRAFVDATITATAASDIFTQDIGDDEAEPEPPPKKQSAGGAPAGAATTTQNIGDAAPVRDTSAKPALPHATEASRAKMIEQLKAGPGDPNRDTVTEYFQKCGQILETENVEDLPLRFVPVSKGQMLSLGSKLSEFGNGEPAGAAFPANDEPEPPPKASKRATKPARGQDEAYKSEPWYVFPMPFGKDAGITLGKLDKKKLFGWWANYAVETEYNGKPKKPETIAKDTLFRTHLDEAGKHYGFTKPEDDNPETVDAAHPVIDDGETTPF